MASGLWFATRLSARSLVPSGIKGKFFDILGKLLDEYLTPHLCGIDHIYFNHTIFWLVWKKCGRVTNYKNNNSNF